jgi:redox-sensitive bicupin YhaK (pirin superfamily)
MTLQIITPVTHDLGAFQVRRAIPSRQRTMVGPFIFVDQFGPAHLPDGQAMDVRPHPHINLATVTWLFEGAIDHRDSLGTFATIRPGQVNLMTAGSGIVHSERSPPSERPGGPKLYGMQTWLALPDGMEEIAPAFEAQVDLPMIEDTCVRAQIIMGNLWGKTAPTTAMPRRSTPKSSLVRPARSRLMRLPMNARSCWSAVKPRSTASHLVCTTWSCWRQAQR